VKPLASLRSNTFVLAHPTSLRVAPWELGRRKPRAVLPRHTRRLEAWKKANHIYLTATVDAAVWGAELAAGEEPGRIYVVAPTGPIEDDPNLTDKKFSGNPTKSYRSRDPLRVTGELADWRGHAPDVLQAMKDSLERLMQLGIEAIDD
jgi:hypothetical protein